MKQLIVNTSKSYPAIITDSLNGLKELVSEKFKQAKKVLIISDNNVYSLYGKEVLANVEKECQTFIIESGEASKSIQNYINILNFLAESGFSRSDGIIGLGGGVVGDLAAFVASTYMRGINYIAVPTTVLSFVDSSVGGKTAINLQYGKNLVGTFFQPNAVFINYSFTKTLPLCEVKSGWGEIAKYYFISDKITKEELFGELTEELIYKCIACKAEIIKNDEFDFGKRKLLNFGHTFGHAIEKLSGYTLSHGECVVKGMYLSLLVSKNLLNLSQGKFAEIKAIFENLGYNLQIEFSLEDLLAAIKADKKADGEAVDFVLLNKEGVLQIQKISFDKLIGAIYER